MSDAEISQHAEGASEAASEGAGVAIVTGASSGIGEAIVRRLARDGFDVVLTSRDPGRLIGLADTVVKAGRRALTVSLDLSSLHGIESAFGRIEETFGTADLLINNAGCTIHRPALDITLEDWDTVIDTNLRGTFFITQVFARRLTAAGRSGHVINFGSTHGLVGYAQRSVYGVSKAGIAQLGRMLAIEWADYGIRVNTVAPGTVETPSRLAAMANPETRQAMLDRVPMRRFATPDEVAAAVSYLASADASYLNGTTIVLDGGLTAA